MNIRFFRSLWGAHLPTLNQNLAATKDAGFDGIEFIAPAQKQERAQLKKGLNQYGLDFILQIGTGAGTGPAIGPESVAEHRSSLEREFNQGLELQPLFVNSHTGRDIFSFTENFNLFQRGKELAREHGISLLHESHRGRALSTLPTTLKHLQHSPDLKLTGDFSHWTCAHESLLEDQEEAMNLVLPRVHHIHARIGNEQSPQLKNPHQTIHQTAVDAHFSWWKQIVEHRRRLGSESLTFTVEFGPPPYYQGPYEAAELWQLNLWMLDELRRQLV